MYSVLRGDLLMSEGKANAQAGHAYVDALLHSLDHPDPAISARAGAYKALRPGTKICLDGGTEARFFSLIERLRLENIPHVVITDRDHIEPPHFDGSPVVTAIGIGPLTRAATPKFLRKPSLWAGGARHRLLNAPKGRCAM
ncbi:MAG: peptidyl-tRNA hydrolase [Roseibium sp.]|uniref:peptidyl-tRNA hydrolase n=1 Tax=Roseibium sp. TaxID=1936156 RepID=UPI003299DD42